jgi:hypothetical protein
MPGHRATSKGRARRAAIQHATTGHDPVTHLVELSGDPNEYSGTPVKNWSGDLGPAPLGNFQ